MKDLDDFGQSMEKQFGLISGWCLWDLHRVSVAAGSNWDIEKPETMDIIVNKDNAAYIYGLCKEIRSNGYSVGRKHNEMQKIKQARLQAHKYLFEEANNPETPIERKIYLVKLTGKNEY